jgi:hypothetical protein
MIFGMKILALETIPAGICEQNVYRKRGSLDVSQPYGPPWPVTGISFTIFRYYRVLTMVYKTQRYWVFGLCPSSGF